MVAEHDTRPANHESTIIHPAQCRGVYERVALGEITQIFKGAR